MFTIFIICRRLIAGWAAALVVPCCQLSAQAAGTGDRNAHAVLLAQVIDASTERPVPDVRVTIAGTASELRSDSRGNFIIALSGPTLLTLTLTRLGYDPVTQLIPLRVGDTTRLSILLDRAATELDTVNVLGNRVSRSAKLGGFDRRREQNGGGVFITRDEIEKSHAERTTALLLKVIGLRIVDSSGVKLLASARGARVKDERIVRTTNGQRVTIRGPDLAPCYLAVGVDGQFTPWGFSVDEISPNDIYGIEIYDGPASMPAEMMPSSASGFCGLVMIWTRTGS